MGGVLSQSAGDVNVKKLAQPGYGMRDGTNDPWLRK
jgi:hypothetical protein